MNSTRHTLLWPTIFWAGMGVFVSLFSVTLIKSYQPQSRMVSAFPITDLSPTPIVFVPNVTISSEISSDGTRELTLKQTTNKDNTNTYEFSTSIGGAGEHIVFQKTIASKKSMLIPFNTWSPDNQFFFIQENDEKENIVMVFKATGEPFTNGEPYLDLTASYQARGLKNNLSEVTGWASPTLILINTTTPEGIKSSSYWFEVPSRAIIQLGTQF